MGVEETMTEASGVRRSVRWLRMQRSPFRFAQWISGVAAPDPDNPVDRVLSVFRAGPTAWKDLAPRL
jgi:hypothetical protein